MIIEANNGNNGLVYYKIGNSFEIDEVFVNTGDTAEVTRNLLAALIETLYPHKPCRLYLVVDRSNSLLIGCCKELGFDSLALLPDFYGNSLDAVMVGRMLV